MHDVHSARSPARIVKLNLHRVNEPLSLTETSNEWRSVARFETTLYYPRVGAAHGSRLVDWSKRCYAPRCLSRFCSARVFSSRVSPRFRYSHCIPAFILLFTTATLPALFVSLLRLLAPARYLSVSRARAYVTHCVCDSVAALCYAISCDERTPRFDVTARCVRVNCEQH